MTTLEQLVLPISFYLLVDNQASPNPDVSTQRSLSATNGFRPGIYEPMARIWSQAGIRLEPQSIEFLQVPTDVLEGICQAVSEQELVPHMLAVSNLLPNTPAVINGFYVLEMPVNGISLPDVRIFSSEMSLISLMPSPELC